MIVHAIKTAPICIKLDNAYAGVSSLGVPPGGPPDMAPPDFGGSGKVHRILKRPQIFVKSPT